MGQPVDDLGAPALIGLPGQNIATDLPVEQHQFAVDRQSRPLLGAVNAVFQFPPANRCSLAVVG